MTVNYVVFGAGGVGKTTTSAALGIALATRGARTLVVTTDPARRLAHALGEPASTEVSSVAAVPGLDFFMPDAGATTRSVATAMLSGAPAIAATLAGNPVFELLCSGLAGMHELAALASLATLAARYDAVVVDTAPSAHALELVTLPMRISALIDTRALVWLAQLSEQRIAERRGLSRRLLDWGQRRLVGRFESVLGGAAVAACLEVIHAMAALRPQLSERARLAGELLAGPRTQHVVVLPPRPGADQMARTFSDELAQVARRPSLYVINRVPSIPPWAASMATSHALADPVRRAAQLAMDEGAVRIAMAERLERSLAAEAHVLTVPAYDAADPTSVVAAIATRFAALTAPRPTSGTTPFLARP